MAQREEDECPVCKGTLRMAADPNKTYRYVSGYDEATHSLPCNNCGYGMFARPSGKVNLRPDGTPCVHNFVHDMEISRSYNRYKCTHNCGSSFTIDSGD
jgi:hypothetical protein